MRECQDVVDRGREPAVEDGAGACRQHQRLTGARAGAPGDVAAASFDLPAVGTAAAADPQDRLAHPPPARDAPPPLLPPDPLPGAAPGCGTAASPPGGGPQCRERGRWG